MGLNELADRLEWEFPTSHGSHADLRIERQDISPRAAPGETSDNFQEVVRQLNEVVGKFVLRNARVTFPMLRRIVLGRREDYIQLKIVTRVICRVKGVPIDIDFSRTESPRRFSSNFGTPMLDWVRESILFSMTHELDECILFEGHRVFDPHAQDQYSSDTARQMVSGLDELLEKSRGR
jgi:hypothetical protein